VASRRSGTQGRHPAAGDELAPVDERWVRVLVTSAVWIVVLVVVRWLLRRAFDAWEKRHIDVDPAVMAKRRTTFKFLARVVIALVGVIGVWSVLSIFPQTTEVAKALLASSAVLALIAGLALTTPLGNLGSGVLVAFTQPVRLGDRVTVGEHTGFVEEINLIYTELVTDDARRVFLPNTQLTTGAIINRTIRDPRRTVAVELPLRLDASVSSARDVLLESAGALTDLADPVVRVSSVTEKLVWVTVTGYAPLDADVAAIGGELRERGLAALGRGGLLPA
jgi:small-conductance mechanosensitive channel